MADELIPHVDEQGRFIRWVTRSQIHRDLLIHRSVHVIVHHPDGRILVQRRHRTKQNFPSFWDVACSGHVDQEDHPNGDGNLAEQAYHSSASREIQEELGISPLLRCLGPIPPVPGVNYEYAMLYQVTSEGPFTLQKDEVEEVMWVTPQELDSLEPITPNLKWMHQAGYTRK